MFLLSALVALQHECAHAFAAAKLGYKLDRVVLMPYGAVIDGDLSGISLKDEFFVAVWGPLCNLFTAAGFAALWWFWPDTYAFTDTACFISLAIGLVNFIPAYPLDGGRVLKCALRTWVKEKSAERICRGVTLSVAAGLLTAFVVLRQKNSQFYAARIYALSRRGRVRKSEKRRRCLSENQFFFQSGFSPRRGNPPRRRRGDLSLKTRRRVYRAR